MDIYEPQEDSELLSKYVAKLAIGRVLDMGTGSGILALAASQKKDVREVLAVDINELAIAELKRKIGKNTTLNKNKKKEKLNQDIIDKKIIVKKSNLFSQVDGVFSTIIFNPPYLPQDKINKQLIDDPALYGGKKGWELLAKFFSQVTNYLLSEGKILIVFSSLTNKEKVNQIIHHNLFEFEELEKINLPFFEELYVYLVVKSKILREIEKKNVRGIKYFAHGQRGNVFTGIFDKSTLIKSHFAKPEPVKVAIKITREESQAQDRIKNEVQYLRLLNQYNIGPKLFFYGDDFLVEEFIEGEFILDFIKKSNKNKIKKIIACLLKQCYEMDRLEINKEEMHHPLKHIIIKGAKPILLDFERCFQSKKPHNVTQFGEFIMRNKLANKKKMIDVLQKYKKERNESNFNDIVGLI